METIENLTKQLDDKDLILNTILETTLAGFWDWQIQENTEYLSPRFKKMFGYEDHEMDNKPESWQKIMHPDDLTSVFESFNKHVESFGKIPFDNTVRYYHKDGSIVWIHCKGKVIQWDQEKKPVRMIGSHIDVTDLMNEKIELENNLFQNSIEYAPTAILSIDKNSTITNINKEVSSLFGYEPKELVNSHIEKLIPIEYRENHKHHVKNFIANPKARLMANGRVLFAVKKDGTEFPVRIGLNPIKANNNLFISCTITDISESVEYQQKLKAERERFELAIQGSSVGIWDWFDINKDKEYWSPKFYHLLGYEDQEISASLENFEKIIHPDDKERTFKAVENHFKKDIPFNVRYRLKTKSGNYRWFTGTAAISRDDKNNPIRMVGSIQDIQNLVDHENKLSDTIQKLKQSNQDLEKFTYIASHDLQEPLRTISSFVGILKTRINTKEDEELNDAINFIENASKKMRRQIVDILDYSRLNADVNVTENINISELLTVVKENIHYLMTSSNAEINFIDTDKVIKGNTTLLTVLFTNLISNAIKFSKVKPEVTVSLKELNSEVEIAVKDNGIGIEKKYQHKIFGLFERLHSYDEFPGTGIGLSTCKKIVKLHSGKIWLQSKQNEGTTFFFTLKQ